MIMIEKVIAALKLIRVNQWQKNAFVFLPLFFGLKLFDKPLLLNTLFAFVGFSLITGCVYIFNDWKDIEEDRNHPIKKNRPLAKGTISLTEAFCLALFTAMAGITLLLVGLNNVNMYWVLGLVAFYMLQNFAYTVRLKHIAILDVIILANGFLIRVMVGGVVTGIALSQWLVIMTFLISLFLGLAKRRDDVLLFLKTNEKTRKNIDGYNLDFLNATMILTSSIVIVAYIMYTTSAEVTTRINEYVYATSFFVITGIFRYLNLIYVKNESGDPSKILLKDKFLQLQIIGWVTTFFVMLYIAKM